MSARGESGLPLARNGLSSYSMIALEQIHQLPLPEKLRMMEAIWDDICRQKRDLEVAQWHKELLDERERLLAEGKAEFLDWEEGRRQIDQATQ